MATNGIASAYTIPATSFSKANGRLGEDDQQGADERPDREREHEADPDREATRNQRPRTSSPLRRKAPSAEASSSSTTCARNAHRTASQSAIGLRTTVAVSTTQARPRAAACGTGAETSERQAVRVDRPDLVPPVDLDERLRGRGLHEPEAEQRERRAERDHEQHQRARPLARGVDAQQPEASEHERLDDARSRSRAG
jgi:hypothetical protein